MERSRAIVLTKSLLREYYEYGSIKNIMDILDEDAIAFGIRSDDYHVGPKAVRELLEKEHLLVAPCTITKMGCTEKVSEDGGCTVYVNLIFRRKDRLANMHRVRVMYRQSSEGAYSIRGLHFVRDVRHEATYRLISTRIMNEGAENTAEDIMDMVSSYVNCAYVVYRSDEMHSMSYYSDELWRMMGYADAQEFEAACPNGYMDAILKSEREDIRESLRKQLLKKEDYQIEYHLIQKSGKLLSIMECGRYVLDKQAGIGTLNGIVTDVTPLKQSHDTYLFTLRHDALTGIFNKNAFFAETEEILTRNPDTGFEIMCMDIARFKIINDLFGEETGDRLLTYVARFLKNMKMENCTYGRLHSDNFVICYPSGTDNRNRLVHSLQMLASSFALDYRVDFYFGVYVVADRSLSVSAMCDRASMALAKSNNNGFVTCTVFDEKMRDGIVNEQVIVNNMADSLENGDFLLYLQPKYELMAEKIVGAEALVRWIHPKLGNIPPDRFIPIFEHTGFIYRMDKYIWEKACQLLRQDLDRGTPVMPISVNVSRVDLYSPTIIQDFTDLLERYRLPPRLLELELTESAYVENPKHIIEITKQLQKLGFPILMDDFGSGYSSLNMLKDMPVDILKIDLKFLSYDEGEDNGRAGNILNSIVRMAKWLHIPVIAEGVETRQQVDFLRTIGCECVQGYYYSKPVTVDVYEKLIEKNSFDKVPEVHLGYSDTVDMMSLSAQLTVLFNSTSEGIGLYEIMGDHLELLRANDGYFNLFGDDRDTVYDANRSVINDVHPKDRDTLWAAIEKSEKTKKPAECVVRRYCVDGRMLWLRVRASIIFVEQMRKLLYLVMEEATTAEQDRMQIKNMSDSMTGGFGVYELKGEDIYCHFLSKWLTDINGQQLMDADGRIDKEYLKTAVPASVCGNIRRAIKEAGRTGRLVTMEYPFKTADQRNIWLKATFCSIGKDGDSHLCYAFIHEIMQ